MSKGAIARLDKLEALAAARRATMSKEDRDAVVEADMRELVRAYLAGEGMEEAIRSRVPDGDVSPGTIGERRLAAVRAAVESIRWADANI